MSVGRLNTAIRTATRLHVALRAPPVVATTSAAAARRWDAMSFGGKNQAVRACMGWASRAASGGVLQGRLAPTRCTTDGHAVMPSMQTARLRSSAATSLSACVPSAGRALPLASGGGSVVSWGGVVVPSTICGANIRGLSMSASPLHPTTAESPALKEHVFAVVQINGKQYKVTESDFVVTAKLPVKVGTVINLEKVLLVGADAWTAIGTPLVPSSTARVSAIVHDHHRGAKLQVFKKKKRKGYTRKKGHRTDYTTLRIVSIKCAVPPPPLS